MMSTTEHAFAREIPDSAARLLRDLIRRGLPVEAVAHAARLVAELEALIAEERRDGSHTRSSRRRGAA